MGIEPGQETRKCYFFGYIVHRLLLTCLGRREQDDRDHLTCKRYDMAGALMVRFIVPLGTLSFGEKAVLNGLSSTRVSLWDSLMFGRLAVGFASVRAGTRVLTP